MADLNNSEKESTPRRLNTKGPTHKQCLQILKFVTHRGSGYQFLKCCKGILELHHKKMDGRWHNCECGKLQTSKRRGLGMICAVTDHRNPDLGFSYHSPLEGSRNLA